MHRVYGLAWNTVFFKGVCTTPCAALAVWGTPPAALPFAVLQPSLSAEHHFGTFILHYISHYHIHTYHTILQTPELADTEESNQLITKRLYRAVISQMQKQQNQKC